MLKTGACLIQGLLKTGWTVYVGEDISSFEILTPAHFLSLNSKVGLPAHNQDTDHNTDSDYDPQATSADKLVAVWKKGTETHRGRLESMAGGLCIKS